MEPNKKIIYVTHCSAKKDLSVRKSGEKVTPDRLYIATPTQRFMKTCIKKGVTWAIFSDKNGIWFSNEKNIWYEKSPNKVTEEEFQALVNDFIEKLKGFDKVYFYHNPGRFHKLYRRLLNHPKIKDKIILITHLEQIS